MLRKNWQARYALSLAVLIALAMFPCTACPAEVAAASPLGRLGVGLSLLGKVCDRSPLTAADREPFYQLFAAVQKNDPALYLHGSSASDRPSEPVAALFHDPAAQRGQVFRLLGTASRILRVPIDDTATRARLKVDHYFEVDFVTPDSQGNPLVACVAELPPGLAPADECREPIEVTAFYFKLWQYPVRLDEGEYVKGCEQPMALQSAPLLIGQSLKWLEPPEKPRNNGSWVIASLLALGILGMAMLLWGVGQSDREFFQRWILGRHKSV